MRTAPSAKTIEEQHTLFSRFGIPKTLVSDNGPQFTGEAFEEFMHCNGILDLRSAPYHPQSNGLAERAVRTVKEVLNKNVKPTLFGRLAKALHRYRRAPLKCGRSPSYVVTCKEIRSRLDNLVPRPNDIPLADREKPKKPKFYIVRPV